MSSVYYTNCDFCGTSCQICFTEADYYAHRHRKLGFTLSVYIRLLEWLVGLPFSECTQSGRLEICVAPEQQGLNTAPLLKTVEPVYWASPLQADTCAPPGLHATPKRRKPRPTTTCLPLGSHVTGRAVACLNDFSHYHDAASTRLTIPRSCRPTTWVYI